MTTKNTQWDRAEFNIRLSRQRLPKLKKLATMLGPDATPMDAIDFALERAAEVMASNKPDDIAMCMELLASQQDQSARDLADRVGRLHESLEKLRELMARVVEAEDGA